MKLKYNSNIISGGIFAIVSLVLYLLVDSQIKTLESSAVNAKSVPNLVLILMFIFSLLLFIKGLTSPKKEVAINADFFKEENVKKELRQVGFIVLLLVYALLFSFVGFIIATCLLVSIILFFYHCKTWWYYAIANATVIIVYIFFDNVLHVALPTLFL